MIMIMILVGRVAGRGALGGRGGLRPPGDLPRRQRVPPGAGKSKQQLTLTITLNGIMIVVMTVRVIQHKLATKIANE